MQLLPFYHHYSTARYGFKMFSTKKVSNRAVEASKIEYDL